MLAIRRYLPGEQEALDVLQDGFLKVFGNIGGYTFRGSFEGWMRRIMVNLAIDALRADKQLHWVGEKEEIWMSCLSGNGRMTGMARNGPDSITDILDAMEELSPMYRAVFNLCAIEDHGHREISAVGISEGTSKSNYAKARHVAGGKGGN